MGNLAVDYGQASTVNRNISSALNYLEEEISKISSAISEIQSLNRGYGKTSTILNELYDQQKKAQTAYNEMQQFSNKFSGFITNVKTTDQEMAKKFTADVKTYCKKNNIEITSEFAAFLDKVQLVLDVVGFIPVFGEVADALNALISVCRGNYLEALICLVAILPMGDLLKGLKFADKAKDILKLGDKALTATKVVAKEGAEKLSKQMAKVVKSGKLDNVIATMDSGKDFIVRFKDGSTALMQKGDLSEFICQVFNKGCFMAGTLVNTKEGLKAIEEVKIGDYVLSRNEESGETSYKIVTDTLVRSTYNRCTIELENGKIISTTGHLFMVKDKWWKAASELSAGDILETADGKCQIVKSIEVEEKAYPITTYNLSVEENHTFFVGSLGILTHNMAGFKNCESGKEVIELLSEADRIKQINLQNSRAIMEEELNIFRKEFQKKHGMDGGSTYNMVMDATDTSKKGLGTNRIYEYNPSIKDYNDPRKFCTDPNEYVEYYKYTLTDEYIDNMPNDFIKDIDKESVKKEMKKLRQSIDNTKVEAEKCGLFNRFGEPSFQESWNVENCAEVWGTRNGILNGGKFDDFIMRTVNANGNVKLPCDNCEITFIDHYIID